MATTYTYSITTDFGGSINLDQLTMEIDDNLTVTTTLDHINRIGDQVDIIFVSALSAPELTELTTVVIPGHTPVQVANPNFHVEAGDPATTSDEIQGFNAGSHWTNSVTNST